jgi:exosortase
MAGMKGPMKTDRLGPMTAVWMVATAAIAAGAYWTTLAEVSERWATDPQYSHGFLVPLFSLYLLWSRRRYLASGDFSPRWWGVGIVAIAIAMRAAGYAFFLTFLDTGSLIICLLGLAAAVGGRGALRWAAPAILFLAFMLPLPHRVQTVLGGTLQRVATVTSTYALQTLGVPAVSEGNIIMLTDTQLGVVEACNGLSMLMTFFALATAVAILSQRGLFEKLVIVASAIPIAVLANVARITVTGMLYEASQGELARMVFHDLAGWLMMPLALGMLLVELWLLGRILVPVQEGRPWQYRRQVAAR